MNDTFLTLYQQIEQEIKENYSYIITPGQNVVASLSNLEQFKSREDLLMTMKNIRNILSHYKQINGNPVIYVNQCLIDAAEQILKELKEPYFVELDKKCKTVTLDTKVIDAIKYLKGKNVLPILNNEKQVVGIISVEHLPDILCSKKMSDNAALKDFKKLFGLDYYLYSKPEISKKELKEIIEHDKLTGKMVKCFIFTNDGTNKGKFVSIINAQIL